VNALVRQGDRKARAVTPRRARSFSLASLLLFGARRRAAFALYGGIHGEIEAGGYDVLSARAHVPLASKLRTVATLLRPRTVLPAPDDVPAVPLLPRGAS
jgi:15-cis-phytoene synthase